MWFEGLFDSLLSGVGDVLKTGFNAIPEGMGLPLALGAGGLVGSVLQSGAARRAGNRLTEAGQNAAINAENKLGLTREQLAPFISGGADAVGAMKNFAPSLTPERLAGLSAPFPEKFEPTQEWLETQPGYQFAKQQGIKATTSSAAARGLGTSGSLLQGISKFTTGLADQNYGSAFQRFLASQQAYLNQNQLISNMLLGRDNSEFGRLTQRAQVGSSAAGTLAGANTGTAQVVGNSLVGGAQGAAQGTLGSANAWSNALGGLGNNFWLAYLMRQMGGNNLTGQPGTPVPGRTTVNGNVMAPSMGQPFEQLSRMMTGVS